MVTLTLRTVTVPLKRLIMRSACPLTLFCTFLLYSTHSSKPFPYSTESFDTPRLQVLSGSQLHCSVVPYLRHSTKLPTLSLSLIAGVVLSLSHQTLSNITASHLLPHMSAKSLIPDIFGHKMIHIINVEV